MSVRTSSGRVVFKPGTLFKIGGAHDALSGLRRVAPCGVSGRDFGKKRCRAIAPAAVVP